MLLAAGGGTRFGGPTHKLLAMLDGRPVYRWALDHVVEAGFDDVVVVTGAVDLDIDIAERTCGCPQPGVAATARPASLQIGLAAAAGRGSDHVVVGLADQPFIPASAWRAVAGAASTSPIVVATYRGCPRPEPCAAAPVGVVAAADRRATKVLES